MLVLSRKEDEAVYVDGPCTIIVSRIHGDTVEIGFAAPYETTISRREIPHELIREMRKSKVTAGHALRPKS